MDFFPDRRNPLHELCYGIIALSDMGGARHREP